MCAIEALRKKAIAHRACLGLDPGVRSCRMSMVATSFLLMQEHLVRDAGIAEKRSRTEPASKPIRGFAPAEAILALR